VNLQKRFAIFRLIAFGQYVSGQFALFAKQDQRFVELVSQYRANQKAAGIHGADVAEVSLDVALDKAVGDFAHGAGRLVERGDVAKDDARLGEINYRADQGFEAKVVEDHIRCPGVR